MPTAMHSHFICSFARSAFEIMSYMVAPLLLLLVVSCACCVLLPLLASMAAIRASMSVYFRIPESLCLKMTSVPLNTNVPPCCTSSLVSGGLSSPPAHTAAAAGTTGFELEHAAMVTGTKAGAGK